MNLFHKESRDYLYLTAMDEVLTQVLEFTERARDAQDDVQMYTYLKMASRSMREALGFYADHLAQTRAEMELGEEVK